MGDGTCGHTHPSKSLGVPWIGLAEFWHGATLAKHDPNEVREFLSLGMPIVDATPVIPTYAKICAELSSRSAYKNMGQNDLWIAAVALAFDKPLVTRNVRHFEVISGLKLEVLEEK